MITSTILTFVLSISCSYSFLDRKQNCCTSIEQHPSLLLYDYNECNYSNYLNNDEDKAWFVLERNGVSRHFPHSGGASTIKYFISETSEEYANVGWNYNMVGNLGDEVKNNILNSILKWNEIYFYKYVTDSSITKNKLVNIVEGSASDHNVIIYPTLQEDMYYDTSLAETSPLDYPIHNEIQNSVQHEHYLNWKIKINIESEVLNNLTNRVGAHEFGHILGLRDIDACENSNSANYHHSELLMGYASPSESEITYQDLVGAAITRGYHTDSDHHWLYDAASSSPGYYKLICSICNGVRYIDDLNELNDEDYSSYKACYNYHSYSDGNMFAVASYGHKDYYKCKYCSYVAPFTSNVNQNYTAIYYDYNSHIITNNINGLEYTFYEPHSINENGICESCNHEFFHSYNDHYSYYSNLYHKAYCGCGIYELRAHAIRSGSTFNMHGHTYGYCIGCGALIDMGSGPVIVIPDTNNSLMVTDNGSYILLNGLYIIVDDDLSDYLNGNLVFHSSSDITA